MGFIRILNDDLVCLKVHRSDCCSGEYETELAKTIAGLYRPVFARVSVSLTKGITIERKQYVAWEIELKNGSVNYYLVCPQKLARLLKFKIHSVWEDATIEQVKMPAELDWLKSAGCELRYKRLDIFSLNTEYQTDTAAQIMKIARNLQAPDRAVVQVIFDPISQRDWKSRACQTYLRLLRGAMHAPVEIEKPLAAKTLYGSALAEMVKLVFKASGYQSIVKQETYGLTAESRLLLLRKVYDPAKPDSMAVRTFIRIAAESSDPVRAVRTVNSIVVAYKQLNGDNELEKRDKNSFRKRFIRDINLRRPPLVSFNGNIMSVKECTKLMDLN